MARIAINAVVHITADTLMMLVGLSFSVTIRT